MRLEQFRAGPEHAEAFFLLERLAGDARTYGPVTDLAAALREIDENRLYLFRLEGTIVGSAAYRVRGDGSVHISSVTVHPDYRRRGVARAAMRFLLELNPEAARIDLVTHPENAPALALYSSLGFVIEERLEDYYGDGEPRLMLALQQTRRMPPK
jgi:ribosomal protein S18 acetylase RimI-like enzyme